MLPDGTDSEVQSLWALIHADAVDRAAKYGIVGVRGRVESHL